MVAYWTLGVITTIMIDCAVRGNRNACHRVMRVSLLNVYEQSLPSVTRDRRSSLKIPSSFSSTAVLPFVKASV